MKQKPFELKTIGYANIETDALAPHPDAEAFWMRQTDEKRDDEDQNAIMGDIAENGIIEPLTVRQVGDTSYQILDGVSRYMAARDLGLDMLPCQIVEIAHENVATLIIAKNTMRHRLATGQRIMRVLEANVCEVLETWEAGQNKAKMGESGGRGKKAQSRDSGFSSAAIAIRLGTSQVDVLKGIVLLAAHQKAGLPVRDASGATHIVPFKNDKEADALASVYRSVVLGKTPVRRWEAAVGGRVSTVDQERPATNYGRIFSEAAQSLIRTGDPDVWLPMDPAIKKDIYERLNEFILAAPDDLIHVIKDGLKAREGGTPKKAKK